MSGMQEYARFSAARRAENSLSRVTDFATLRTVDRTADQSTDRAVFSSQTGVQEHDSGRPVCAAADCAAGWRKLWKRRPRPVFEGGWGCSKACVRTLVRAAVLREMGGAVGADAVETGHQHRMPLGLMLLAQGLVTEAQLRTALDAQQTAGGGRIGKWLVDAAGVPETKIMRGIGMQWQCPVLSTTGFDAARMALVMPRCLHELCSVTPVRIAGTKLLYLGFAEQVDSAAAFALERMHDLTVESGVLPLPEFETVTDRLRESSGVACSEATVADAEEMVEHIAATLGRLLPVASRLVRLRDRYWLRLWLERGTFSASGMLPATAEDMVDVVMRLPG